MYNKMFKAMGNALFEFEFLGARIKRVLSFTFRCAAVSGALTLVLGSFHTYYNGEFYEKQ